MTRSTNWTAGTKCRVEWGGSWMLGGGANYAAAAYAQDMAKRLPASAL